MTRPGSGHPLDVELADLADGTAAGEEAGALDSHLERCLLCRLKLARLRDAPPPPEPGPAAAAVPGAPTVALPRLDPAADPTTGDLWLAGVDDERILVTVLRLVPDRALVAPVTLDVEAADEETVLVDPACSPIGLPLAVFPTLATEVPRSALVARVGTGLGLGLAPPTALAAPVAGATDPRLEVRQHLAARLAGLEDVPPDPATALDAPRPGPGHLRSALLGDLRAMRGAACRADVLDGWGGVSAAVRQGWTPMAVIDEIGVVLVVLDTPAGLSDDVELDAARAVLTRFNATALVVLAAAVSDSADVYDAPALNAGIDVPTGRHAPPRPLISGLSPFDAIAKYLDQHTGARTMGPPTRGAVGRVDVGDVLRAETAAAMADLARQGARFKIAPKRRGYESAAADADAVADALARALTAGAGIGDGIGDDEALVVEHLIDLARRRDGDSAG